MTQRLNLIQSVIALDWHYMNSILTILEDERIVQISKNPNGTFTLTEMCDQYFEVTLTSAQLMQLTVEIRELLKV